MTSPQTEAWQQARPRHLTGLLTGVSVRSTWERVVLTHMSATMLARLTASRTGRCLRWHGHRPL